MEEHEREKVEQNALQVKELGVFVTCAEQWRVLSFLLLGCSMIGGHFISL